MNLTHSDSKNNLFGLPKKHSNRLQFSVRMSANPAAGQAPGSLVPHDNLQQHTLIEHVKLTLQDVRITVFFFDNHLPLPTHGHPVILNVHVHANAANLNDREYPMKQTGYEMLYHRIAEISYPASLDDLAQWVAGMAVKLYHWDVRVVAVAPELVPHAEGGLMRVVTLRKERNEVEIEGRMDPLPDSEWQITSLRAACIITGDPHEDNEKQLVKFDLNFRERMPALEPSRDELEVVLRTSERVRRFAEGKTFGALSALATGVLRLMMDDSPSYQVKVTCEQLLPSHMRFAKGLNIEVDGDLVANDEAGPNYPGQTSLGIQS